MTEAREDLVYNSKLAEQAERYDEMKEFMKLVARLGRELSVEERNLLSVAYKNAVGARRASWRIVSSVEEKKKSRSQTDHADLAGEYKKRIEVELKSICDDILSLLDEFLIPASSGAESQVFFYKMKGDYYRYIAEFADSEGKKIPTKNAEEAYGEATKLADAQLPATHPIRLGLALNFSVFHYEILNNPPAACEIAKKSFDLAITELDSVSEDSYRDSTLIMHLLRDNLTLWSPNPEESGQAAADLGDDVDKRDGGRRE